MSLDNLELPEFLGSVAGEDTVFVVMKEGVGKDQFLSSLRNKVPGLERK
jgi:transcriptional regulator of arginine metabolism